MLSTPPRPECRHCQETRRQRRIIKHNQPMTFAERVWVCRLSAGGQAPGEAGASNQNPEALAVCDPRAAYCRYEP